MQFNSYVFILAFLPVVLIGYYLINHFRAYKCANVWLIISSCIFYGYFNVKYLFLLFLSVLINYVLAWQIRKNAKGRMSRGILIVGLILDIGTLFILKYFNFFIKSTSISFIVPVGISFYTFQQISFLIDTYRGETEEYSILEYITYITFFPTVVSGPIAYHSEVILPLRKEENRRFNYENMLKGMQTFAIGLFKKVMIADLFAKLVNVGFENYLFLNSIDIALVMIAYSLQIYFDFSGYSEMAMGIAYMFNISLPLNFDSPYQSRSIAEFFNRWHITLNRFFLKYLYIPLGGSRKGKVRTCLNIMIVFAISGLWHGANWTFIAWGIVNGLFVVGCHLLKGKISKIPRTIGVSVTFIITTFLWTIFRADSIQEALGIFAQLFHGGVGRISWLLTDVIYKLTEVRIVANFGLEDAVSTHTDIILIGIMIVALIIVFLTKGIKERLEKYKANWGTLVSFLVLMIVSILSLSEITEFVYFNF